MDSAGRLRPVKAALMDLVEDLTPVARRLDCLNELHRIPGIIELGSSYLRQRRVAEASGGDLTAVVDSLLDEMRVGLPRSASADDGKTVK